jgi:succinoglycan biosynthesis transport protein ExoP
MKVIELLRILRKHLLLLILTPILMAGLVALFTGKPVYTYTSETTLYTGIASGSSVQLDKAFSYFANNTSFDNLINVITSRETQREVGLRLLAQHLMLKSPDPRYISRNSYENLKSITPAHIRSLIVRPDWKKPAQEASKKVARPSSKNSQSIAQQAETLKHTVKKNQTLFSIAQLYGLSVEELKEMNHLQGNNVKLGQVLVVGKETVAATDSLVNALIPADTAVFSFSGLEAASTKSITLPAHITRDAFEQTVKNLKAYMNSNDTNFLYRLLYFSHPHYSIKAISSITVRRIASSDLVRLGYETNDPGICQQTLAFMTEVCIENYKQLKENRSDVVVKYFEYQLKLAADRLKIGEDKLLQFNKDNNIINYYEQSKAVANVKENLDVEFNNKRIKLAGLMASIKRIEEKLGIQQQIQLKSSSIIEKRNKLSTINSKIATYETIGMGKTTPDDQLVKLKTEAEKLKDEIRNSVNDLYGYGNSTDGLPISKLLEEWIANVIEYEDTKAGIKVLGDRIDEFQKQYAIYAPAGANIKRIEREINVSEQEFLEILHGLNLAKLKMQDAELSSTLKPVDAPYYPISPNPTKRKILIIVAALVGFLITLSIVLASEYFDDTLKDPAAASKKIQLPVIGVFPKILLKTGTLNFLFVTNRLLEMALQKIDFLTGSKSNLQDPKTLLVMSSMSNEGKTVLASNLALKLKKMGKKVLYLNFSRESLRQAETSQIGYTPEHEGKSKSGFLRHRNRPQYLSMLMGYGDNRIDPGSPFLDGPEYTLDDKEYAYYQIDSNYYSAGSITDLARKNGVSLYDQPDYIIVEIPPILYYSFPNNLVASADLSLLVCRANRTWSTADEGALETVKKVTDREIGLILNGVSLEVVESILGDLPKSRSRIRRILKNLVRFQFYSRQQP